MKIILLYAAMLLPAALSAQGLQKTAVKIAFLGDSFCGGGNVVPDSAWPRHTERSFKLRYSSVQAYLLCTGGETTYKGLPAGSWFPPGHDFYSAPDPNRNIEKAIAVLGTGNDDTIRILMLEYSGNDAWIGYYKDSTLKNLATIISAARAYGYLFSVSGMAPRQQSGASGNFLADHYYLTRDSLNELLQSLYPDNYADINTGHTRPPEYRKRLVNELSYDSLHLTNYSHPLLAQDMEDNYEMNSAYCNCKGYAVSYSMAKTGDSLSIVSTNLLGSRVTVSGSDDYVTFTPIDTYKINDGAFAKKVLGNDYAWYKIQIESPYKKTITKTLLINPQQ